MYGGLTLSAAVFQRTCPTPRSNIRPADHNSQLKLMSWDSHSELFPLQSPLLGESWLVSFPPLSYMLKFSGSSYLIWDLIGVLIDTSCLDKCQSRSRLPPLLSSLNRKLRELLPCELREVLNVSSQSPAFEMKQERPKQLRISFPCSSKFQRSLPHNKVDWLSGVYRHSNKHTPDNYRECNVRSKIWWFSRICGSHYVSHFAAFFIVVGAKTSIAESCMAFASCARGRSSNNKYCLTTAPSFLYIELTSVECIAVYNIVVCTTISQSLILEIRRIRTKACTWINTHTLPNRSLPCGNDPSAGSPTETLLRLHLPLNDKV